MRRPSRNLTTLVAKVTEETRKRLEETVGEAAAWLEWVAHGAAGAEGCVVCESKVRTEGNHVAGRRHGDLVVPMCTNCHGRFSKAQYTWDPRWQGEEPSAALDESLMILGLALLCEERAYYRGPAYLELADRLRGTYWACAQGTIP